MSGMRGGFCRRQGEPQRGVSLSRRRRHRSDDVGTRPPVTSVLHHRPGLEGINTGPASQGDTSVRSLIPLRLLSLQTSQQQQQHPASSKSPPLSLFEQEAIRTRGRPWSGHPALRLSEDTWYPVWRIFLHMGERKHKVVRRLEF